MLDLSACWSEICTVDAAPLSLWLSEEGTRFPDHPVPTKPQRLFAFPTHLTQPIVDVVLSHFGEPVEAKDVLLSRMQPGQRHPLHADLQRSGWLTRVHVPLATSRFAWFLWEEDGVQVHFEVGKAYSFNTLRRHAFGNDGECSRVHLIFDVHRKD